MLILRTTKPNRFVLVIEGKLWDAVSDFANPVKILVCRSA